MKIIKRCFRFPVRKQNISDFLQWAEYKEGENLHGNQLAGIHRFAKYQHHQDKQDHLPERIDKSALYKTDTSDALNFG